jgi:hypothetical protein
LWQVVGAPLGPIKRIVTPGGAIEKLRKKMIVMKRLLKMELLRRNGECMHSTKVLWAQ